MIVPPTGVRVLVATRPVDFRRGMDGLAAYAAVLGPDRAVPVAYACSECANTLGAGIGPLSITLCHTMEKVW
jgi:hypothetical protein